MAMKLGHILGLNARNHEYTSVYNSRRAKKLADSKLLTKSILRKHKLGIPKLYRVFRNDKDVESFDYTKLPESFVVKPNKGLGGEGIIVIERSGEYAGEWITTQGETITIRDIKLHLGDILEGRFSMHDLPDMGFIEGRVRIHPSFEPYAYHGTPDIRVIVFNKVPIMAMLRIPTKESGGRANLFQGAVGAGIDLATGVTTYAIQYSKEIIFMPDTQLKIRGIQIPEWEKVLELAIRCQEVTNVGYLGSDIVLQPSIKNPGDSMPMVLELNAQPGLKIQLCNKAGLRRRLERIEGLEVDTPDKGIRIAQELFGDKSLAHLGKKPKKLSVFETLEVISAEGGRVPIKAKIDSGAYRSSIDINVAKELGLLTPENILMRRQFESALGQHYRDVISITFYLAGRKIETTASVVDRSKLKRPMIIGRRDLTGYLLYLGD